MKNKQSLYRFIIYFVEILFFFIIVCSPSFFPVIIGRKPNLLIALIPSIIIFEKSQISTLFGFGCGVLLDQSMNIFFGFNAIIIALLCYFISIFSSHYLKKNFLSLILISTVFIGMFYHLQFLFLYILKGYKEIDYAYFYHYLPPMVLIWFASLSIYLFNSILTFKFRKNVLNFK